MIKSIFILLSLSTLVYSAPKWESIFSKCKSSDNGCLAKAIEDGIKKIAPGIPELNLPPLDPAELKEMSIGAGSSAVHMDQHYTNLKIHGFANPIVKEANFDLDKKILTFSTWFDQLEQKADYEMNGKILIAPVYGKGQSSIVIEKVTLTHKVVFKETEKSGDKYLSVESFKTTMDVGHAKYWFGNLFDGNKELGDNINKLINDEWLAIYNDVKSGYEVAYSALFKQYADKVFSKIPLKLLFT